MPTDALVRAVLFDLDDTLFPQSSWLVGAWDAVAAVAADDGVDAVAFRSALGRIAAAGSAQGGIIDQALAAVGRTDVDPAPLVGVFRSHAPPALACYPGVVGVLEELSAIVPLGVVTDGHVAGQRSKVAALGVERYLSCLVYSDALGRQHRKPSAVPFQAALAQLAVDPAEVVFVGDNPRKDMVGASALGMRTVRVMTGEYRRLPDEVEPWRRASSAAGVARLLRPFIGPVAGPSHPSPVTTRSGK